MNKLIKQYTGITSDVLRLLAAIFMLSDHLWVTIFPGNLWLHLIGRLAFPIYAFFIAEGYFHTSNFKKYALRLLFFGIISEIPFDYFIAGVPFYPYRHNVMFTLLLGLLSIKGVDNAIKNPVSKNIIIGAAVLVASCVTARCIVSDYREHGVLTVLCFYLFRNFKPAQLISMLLLHLFLYEGMAIKGAIFGTTILFPAQSCAVLALLPIWLYNGKRSYTGKALRGGIYLFYPVHMLVLHILRNVI